MSNLLNWPHWVVDLKEIRVDTRTKVCPDCAAEGNPEPQAASAFYSTKAKQYAGGVRLSAYCRRHTKQRTAAAAKSAPPGSGIRQAQQRARQAWRHRNRDHVRAYLQAWRARNKPTVARYYQDWLKRHRATRAASQQAWYLRRKRPQKAPVP